MLLPVTTNGPLITFALIKHRAFTVFSLGRLVRFNVSDSFLDSKIIATRATIVLKNYLNERAELLDTPANLVKQLMYRREGRLVCV